MVEAFLRDLTHAARALAARKTYASMSIFTLALLVGAATAVAAVISATMVRPLPFPNDDRLVQLFLMPPGTTAFNDRNPYSNRVFNRFRAGLRQVEALEGFWARDRALGGGEDPESITAAAVSPGALQMFGGVPLAGRLFTEADAAADARVAILSYGLWQRRYGGDSTIVGSTILIDREPFEVIGIMPREFVPGYVSSELWTPLFVGDASFAFTNTVIQSFARVKPGVTLPQLRSELSGAMERVTAEAPKTLAGWTTMAISLRDAQFGQQRAALLMLLAAVIALAMLACANLSNLTLAQVIARRSDFALRAAIGGSTRDIVRLQLLESALLAAAGIAAGELIGSWTLPVLLALDPQTAEKLRDVHVDWGVRVAMAAFGGGVALLSGVLPLVPMLRGNMIANVANASHRSIGSRRDHLIRRFLVGLQAAIAVVLTICGAMLLTGLNRASRVEPGFDPAHVFGAQMRMSASAYPNPAARGALIDQVIERIRAVPGVVDAGATLNPFIPNFFFQTLLQIDGKPAPDGQPYTVMFRRVTPGYFKTMRIPLIRGRVFDERDRFGKPGSAVVSASFAQRFWPGEDPIGKRVLRGANLNPATVIGIVGDVRDVSLSRPPEPLIYTGYAENNVATAPVSLVVRTSGDPLALTNAIRAAVFSVDPAQPIDHVTTVERFLSDSLGAERFRSALLLVLAAIGVTLAAIGIYGVTARSVQERTQELGVRLALGATPAAVVSAVAQQTLRPVTIGLAAGLALAAIAATALLRGLPGLAVNDAWTAVPALAVLAITAVVAALLPARQVATLDPLSALRER